MSESHVDDASAKQSGQFSRDPVFNPAELFDVIEHEDNSTRALDAMREFVKRGDAALFERAVAVYVRSARTRQEAIEVVLGALQSLADEFERDAAPGYTQRDTPLRHVVLRGVLLAFYGADAVDREATARERRVAARERPA